MASAESFTGFIYSVVPEIGGEVGQADTCLTRRRRRRKIIRVVNPALWNTAGGVTTTVGSRFVRNGVVVLDSAAESCSLNEQSLLEIDGFFSRFDSRIHLKSNSWNLRFGRIQLCAQEQLELLVVSCVPDVL